MSPYIPIDKRCLSFVFLFVFVLGCNFTLWSQAPGCPNVDAGPDETIDCTTASCVNLTASFLDTGETTSYNVSTIPYAPPFSFTGLSNQVNTTTDDVWSSVINLPFNFCFFGQVENQIQVGSNGVIRFDVNPGDNSNAWSLGGGSLPNNSNPTYGECNIFGAGHDINPAVSPNGEIGYEILGSAPCRTFVVSFFRQVHFGGSCSSFETTQMMVLYETTNVIEVYMQDKPSCAGWNGGLAVVGIQNNAGTQAFVPPGRNTGVWTATNEAWRFTPNGPSNVSVSWFDSGNNLVGTGPNFNACPTSTETYTVEASYSICDGSVIDVTDNVMVDVLSSLTSTVNITDIDCFGDLGQIVAQGMAGDPPYTYSLDGGPFQSSGTFNSVPGGPHTVVIEDDLGCQNVHNINLNDPAPITVTEIITPTACGVCAGGIDLTPAGGTPPFQFSLNGGPFQNSGTFTNLCPNNYTVEVRDVNLCSETFMYDLNSVGITASLSGSTIDCFGDLGQIVVTASGGQPPLQYSLDGGPFQASNTFNNVPAGSHTVVIEDNVGCQETENITLTEPTELILASSNVVDISCFGDGNGQITVQGSGGTSPYQYSIDGGPFGNNGTFNNLNGGTYIVDIRDDNNCVLNAGSFTIIEPTELMVAQTVSNTTCGACDGSIVLTPSGGTPNYQFSINGGPFQNNGTFNNLCPDNYSVLVRDANLCQQSFTYDLNSAAISGTVDVEDIKCFGETGKITLTRIGGVAPFSYSIDGTNFQSGRVFNNVMAGTYTPVIRDANNCEFLGNPVTLTEPPELLLTTNLVRDVSCFGGSDGRIRVQPAGGTPGYEFSLNGGAFSNNRNFTNLTAGNYNIRVRDNNGCITRINQRIDEPSELGSRVLSQSDVLCYNGATGRIEIAGEGGTTPYRYSIDGINFQGSGVFDNLNAGTYQFTVRDRNQCLYSFEETIGEPDQLELQVALTNHVSCHGGNDGQIVVDGANGTPPYEYSINGSPFVSSNVFDSLTNGNYNIEIRDANGCIESSFIQLTQPDALQRTDLTITPAKCFGQSNGQVWLRVQGGVRPYSFSINGGSPQSNGLFRFLPSGDHTITVLDNNGCVFEETVNIPQPDELRESSVIIENSQCHRSNDGSILINAIGGTPPYQFKLNNAPYQSANLFENLRAGNYNLKIKDVNGCTYLYPFEITEPEPLPPLLFGNLANSYCDNEEAFEVNVSPSGTLIGGTGIIPGTNTFDPTLTTPGIHEIKLVYTHPITGCMAERVKLIEIFPTTEADFTGLDDLYCWNDPETVLTGIPEGGGFDGIGIAGNTFNASQATAAGVYAIDYTYTNEFGCIDVATNEVEITGPQISIEEEINVNFGDSIILAPVLNFDWNVEGIEFYWEPADYLSCRECANPIVSPPKDVIYEVTAVDRNGCAQTQRIRVNAVKDFRVFIPTAFSPNGDQNNDILVFNSSFVDRVTYFKIFDRWGQMVFEANDFVPNDPQFGWDGTFNGEELNGGSFVYYTEFVFADGKVQTKSGSVMLLR